MTNQMKLEWFKMKRFPLLYAAIVLLWAAAFFHGFLKFGQELGIGAAFADSVCDTSFVFLLSLVSACFIGMDFGYRTIQHEIKLGYSRMSVLLSRALTVIAASAVLHAVFVVSTVAGYAAKNGFEASVLSADHFVWLAVILLQIAAVQSCVVCIAFTVQKAAAVIAAGVCFTFVMCNVLRNFFDGAIFSLSCFCLAQNSRPDTLTASAALAVLTILAVTAAAYLIFRKAEIK